MLQPLRTWPHLLGAWLTFLLLLTGYDGRAQSWNMAQAIGTSELNGQATGVHTIADGTGGLYVTGSFQGAISLGAALCAVMSTAPLLPSCRPAPAPASGLSAARAAPTWPWMPPVTCT
ncbi:hypothetical protein [Hymenobacter cellulosivorans]|uniref:Uncharacterized protein n=1 Tax=Hymenobacter cellulosivorans TaxID=2932249 RepID=A0ABY4FF04_9BACT|nr:hypothetical protein [Hymenobacter cellulosivorans]UOQ54524.1 hypothetical protein MUN80_07110 [Hymenobacter cellulosivorans]